MLEPVNPVHIVDFHDHSNEQVSIIVVHCKNNTDYLSMCLQSIYTTSHLNNYEVIVVDNGSGQETQEYLSMCEKEGVKVVRNDKNLYWSAAANRGVQVADKGSKYYIFMHHDVVILNHGWIDVMVNAAESSNSGFVGSHVTPFYINTTKADYIGDWCLLMNKECFKDCGPWPEELPAVGNGFLLSTRAQIRGYKPQAVQVDKSTICHHYRTFNFEPSEYSMLCENAKPALHKLMREMQLSI
jgi:GT2 family glycosyltransferase